MITGGINRGAHGEPRSIWTLELLTSEIHGTVEPPGRGSTSESAPILIVLYRVSIGKARIEPLNRKEGH